ncbi:MAG: hypothetical protein DGJ47_000739 [Rickettsiaceae bacterium]
MNPINLSTLRKKLLYQSNNRGCKETDLVVGRFTKENINEFNEAELLELQNILGLNDADIYDWYTNKKPLPSQHKSSIMLRLMNFKI